MDVIQVTGMFTACAEKRLHSVLNLTGEPCRVGIHLGLYDQYTTAVRGGRCEPQRPQMINGFERAISDYPRFWGDEETGERKCREHEGANDCQCRHNPFTRVGVALLGLGGGYGIFQ